MSLFKIFTFCLLLGTSKTELWEKELGKEVYIEASEDGLKAVHLECSQNQMKVKVELDQLFDGVIYTRGSYKMGKKPCFLDAQGLENEDFSLEWNFDECKTQKKKKDESYNNVIIVQFEKMLIFPGDMAFELICKGKLF